MGRHFARATLVVAVAFSTVCAVELVLHRLVERPVIASEWVMNRDGWLDPDVIYYPTALRDERAYQTDPSLPVVVAVGDSFTKGYPVKPHDRYPRVLARALVEAGTPANVIAFGLGDSGTDQELRAFERDVLPRLRPDVVVWQLYPNDEWDNVVKATYVIDDGALQPIDVSSHWIQRRQRLYDRIPFAGPLKDSWLVFRFALKAAERGQTSRVPADYGKSPHFWGLEKIRLAIARMKELASDNGYRLYIMLVAPQCAYIPRTERSHDMETFVIAYARLLALLEDEPGFIDARFSDAADRNLAIELFDDGGRDPLAYGGRHFNESGYAMLADLVRARLVRDGALTAAPLAQAR